MGLVGNGPYALAQLLLLAQATLYFLRIPVLRWTEPESRGLGFGGFFTLFIGVVFLVLRSQMLGATGPWPWRILLAFEVASIAINLAIAFVKRPPALHAALCVVIALLAVSIFGLVLHAGPPGAV